MMNISEDHQLYLNEMINNDIQYRTDNNETIVEMNNRIRNSIRVNFNKILLTNQQKNLFRSWEENINNLPNTATRKELYEAAPEECLHIIGL
jgi:hypothetical protein